MLDNDDLICNSGVDFFKNMLSKPSVINPLANPSTIPKIINEDDNVFLCQVPSEMEITNVIKEMNGEATACPDGFTTKFFQKTWDIVKEDVVNAVKDFFEGNPYPKFFSSANIVLIPKKEGANAWKEFRPISLCTFFNKLNYKIIANRLANMLPRIISLNQTGFVKGRSISDNVLLAQKLVHDINNKITGGNIIFKLDITKAYDNLDWSFLYKVMELFGFNHNFIMLIKNSVENCFFSIIINGRNHGFFKSSKGLRQGDTISPALFIIAIEYLSRGLEDLFAKNVQLRYYTKRGFNITHLSFADDFILFTNGAIKNVKMLMKFLTEFQNCSGLAFNSEKSTFIVGKSIKPNRINAIHKGTGFKAKNLPIKYLGTPIFKGKKKNFLFDDIFSIIQKKLANWSANFLSFGGRLVLIKSVLNSIPIYLFHTLMPSFNICSKMERLINRFFWGSKLNSNAIHWAAWSKICGPLEEGGMGCKNIFDSAIAFSHKLWFTFRSNNNLWSRYMNIKYCHNIHPILCSVKNTDSPIWKRLCNIKWEAENFIQWGLGRGDVYFWQDKWLGDFSIDSFLNTHTMQTIKVSSFFNNNCWNVNYLKEVVPDCVVELILNIPLQLNCTDTILCSVSPNGKFHLRNIWENIRIQKPKSNLFRAIWHNNFPISYSILAWRCIKGFIPVDIMLQKKGITLVSKCFCCSNFEDIDHLFINGVVEVWSYFKNIIGRDGWHYQDNLISMFENWLSPTKGHILNLLPILILWYIWKARNEAKYDNIKMDHINIINNIKRKVHQLFNLNVISSKTFSKHANLAGFFDISLDCNLVDNMDYIVYWIKPKPPFVKLNTDGSIDSMKAGAGGLIRDFKGDLLAAFAAPVQNRNVMLAEFQALYFGLELCLKMGFNNVWIEVDSLFLVQIMEKGNIGNVHLFYLTRKIKGMLNLLNYKISHIFREGNVCADWLAKKGAFLEGFLEFNTLHLDPILSGMLLVDKCSLPYIRHV
ncbi:hypothetical protein KFK09_011738 [Dendrobium nobile]|uniref:Reverse transcriptase domain-containing protein n=1 Tax=Dendrobium nobile TaxID=94219 RepID=A0A8T3BGU8_DENNO|nr:hypothetical protein KFK09_011738 [Dendrobium nobile]